jgi:transposase
VVLRYPVSLYLLVWNENHRYCVVGLIAARFVFVFTPKHGSWLNLIETQFSKMTRTMLRGIRVGQQTRAD